MNLLASCTCRSFQSIGLLPLDVPRSLVWDLTGRWAFLSAGPGSLGNEAARARLESWNREVGTVRRRIEKIFGTCKRSYGLRRMRWLGLAKVGLQVRLTAIAYNLRRSVTILRTRIGRSGGRGLRLSGRSAG